ncbi:MAG: AAA domain-containing protein [Polyangiales bacterium]
MALGSERAQALSKSEAGEVLRYWLASLQLEEALATRPRARRPLVGHSAPRLDAPSPGHDYFKLPLDAGLEALFRAQRPLHKPFDAELSAFFETWLATQYRRGEDDRELSHLVAFPVVHLPRGDLAGLLRYGVRLRFGEPGGAQFAVPSRAERRRKQFPPAPSEVRLAAVTRSGRQWPFFVDTRLLHQQLGVAREDIDALFTALRAEEELDELRMLTSICEVLERTAEVPLAAQSGSVLERMTHAMGQLLARNAPRAKVYPVGVVVDGTRAKTTWYLQRELSALIDEEPDVAWELDGCLGAYITGEAPAIGIAAQRALFRGPPLSESQRFAAERTAGSRLTAVQGPPGTGKTTLILHLAAQALVQQVDELAERGRMGSALFVVTSTNNRAVDNVIEPLNAHGELPLALRAGSQRVCEHVLSQQLERAHSWLLQAKGRPAAERTQQLAAALSHFVALRDEVREQQAPRVRAYERDSQRSALQHELSRLGQRIGASGAADVDVKRVHGVYEPLQLAHKRLQELCTLCDAAPGLPQLKAIDRCFRSLQSRVLPELAAAVSAAGLVLELELPPPLPASTDPAVLMEAWGDASELAFARVEELQLRLARDLGVGRLRERARLLERQLAGLVATDAPTHQPENDDLQRALFEAAVQVREAWAAAASDTLVPLTQRALVAARTEFSLRSLWNDDPAVWEALRQLFGLWGCTLLSLGNGFPMRAEAIAQVVIDEAGQCHPAYAISALLRSHAALIIGDVHQLEPVIDLEPADDERVLQSCKLSLSPAALAPFRVHSEAFCSVQALADRAVLERPRLTEHFRCQPEIIAISDALCRYGLQVFTPPEGPAVPLPFLPLPVSFIDVTGEQERLGGSWHNPAELALSLELLQALLRAGVSPSDIAVITPYRGQLELLQKQLARLGVPIDYSLELQDADQAPAASSGGLTLGTVHRFQGGERSIVLFTSVVTRRASLPFLDQRENLLNVAVSRARHRFVALGDRGLLAKGKRTRLLTDAASPVSPDVFREQLRLI